MDNFFIPATGPAFVVPNGFISITESWSPLALGSSLLAWWDAEQGVSLSGSAVTAWTDRKGGYTVSPGAASTRPAFGATSFNGAPGLTFDGSDDYVEMASQPFVSGATPFEVWCVFQQDALAADATNRRLLFLGSATSTALQLLRIVSGGVNRLSAIVGNGTTTVSAINTTTNLSSRHLARVVVTATDVSLYVDDDAPVTAAVVPAIGTARTTIGAISSSSSFFTGGSRDMMVSGLLTTDQATKTKAFFAPRRML